MMRIIIGVILCMILLLPFANDLYHALALPLLQSLPIGGQMIATDVVTPFFIPMKVALLTAFMVSLPHTLYQLWAFVAPGLYTQERRLIGPMVFVSTLLFICGMVFTYFLVLPTVFGFISNTAPEGVAVMTDISKYLDFAISLFIAFGIAFEVPIAVIVLVVAGIISIKTLQEARSYVFVGAFVLGAIFTPPDVISQFMLAIPLYILYETGILASKLVQKYYFKVDLKPQSEFHSVRSK